MKKIFFIMAFISASTSGLIANSSNNLVEDRKAACVDVTLSCGVSGSACVTSMEMLIDHIEHAENYWCN